MTLTAEDIFATTMLGKIGLENLSKMNGEYKGNDLVTEVTNFIAKDKKRPICTPQSEQ